MSDKAWADRLTGALVAGVYRLENELGVGGMGAVYSAHVIDSGAQVAVKVLAPQFAEHPYYLERFEREATAAGLVGGGRIPRVLASGRDVEIGPFLVMELLEGRTLASLLQRTGALAVEEALQIADGILETLVLVHEAGIIHRDLKPANVFLHGTGSPWAIQLIDFGVARFRELSRDTLLTVPGSVIGTPRFMPPEQAKDSSRVDPRSDVYATGALLYSCLAGFPPYHDVSGADLIVALMSGPPHPLDRLAPHVPGPVIAIVERAMARDLDSRFLTAADMRAAVLSAESALRGFPTLEESATGQRESGRGQADRFATVRRKPFQSTPPAGGRREVPIAATVSQGPNESASRSNPLWNGLAGTVPAPPRTLPDGTRPTTIPPSVDSRHPPASAQGSRGGDEPGAGRMSKRLSTPVVSASSAPAGTARGASLERVVPSNSAPPVSMAASRAPVGQAVPTTRQRRSLIVAFSLLAFLISASVGALMVWFFGGAVADNGDRSALLRASSSPWPVAAGTGADPRAAEAFTQLGTGALREGCDRFHALAGESIVPFDVALGVLDCEVIALARVQWAPGVDFSAWFEGRLAQPYAALQARYLRFSFQSESERACAYAHLGASELFVGELIRRGTRSEETYVRWREVARASFEQAKRLSPTAPCVVALEGSGLGRPAAGGDQKSAP